MKEHPVVGMQLASESGLAADVSQAILHHHEHFDGSGYPHGLAGKVIPLAARILAVADAFDAMTTHRPYAKARSRDAAVDELRRHRGSQFDPVVIDRFVEVLSGRSSQPLAQLVAT